MRMRWMLAVALVALVAWLLRGFFSGEAALDGSDPGLAQSDSPAHSSPTAPVVRESPTLSVPAEPDPVESAPEPFTLPAPTADPLPAGTLIVAVMAGEAPLARATALLQRRDDAAFSHLPVEPLAAVDVVRRFTDEYGEARFDGLAPGLWKVGALSPGAALREIPTLELGEAGRRVVVRFGGAGVRGHAFDIDGNGVAGVTVRVDHQDNELAARVITDAVGAWSVAELPAGPYWVCAEYDAGIAGRSEAFREVMLVEDTWSTVDFGSARVMPHLRGVVRDASGVPLRNLPGQFVLATLHFEGEAGYQAFELDCAGAFDVRLVPGTYRVALQSPDHSRRQEVAERLEIGGDLVRDFTMPGITLECLIGPPPAAPLAVSAHPVGAEYPAARHRAMLDEQGVARFFGLEPGPWIVTCAGIERTVEIAAGEVRIRLDLR